jgi:hypothetical protein
MNRPRSESDNTADNNPAAQVVRGRVPDRGGQRGRLWMMGPGQDDHVPDQPAVCCANDTLGQVAHELLGHDSRRWGRRC